MTEKPLQDLPPSGKLVYTVLTNEGELTQQQLAEETMLAKRTVRDALTKLDERGLIEEHIYPDDARQRLYVPASSVASLESSVGGT